MIKYEQFDIEDLESIDPHIIQPIQQPTFDDLIHNQESNSAMSTVQDDSSSSSNNIKMEQCINLDLYLSAFMENQDDKINFVDELNTPTIFDAAKELNFINNNNIPNMLQTNGNPFNFPIKVKCEDGVANKKDIKINYNENSVISSDIPNNSSPNNAFTSMEMEDINMDEYDFLIDCNDAILNDINEVIKDSTSNDASVNINTLESSQTIDHHNYALKLDLDPKYTEIGTLQTPDVINTICSIEKDYNFYTIQGEIVQPEDIIPVTNHIPHSSASPSFEISVIDSCVTSPSTQSSPLQLNAKILKRNSKKRKKYESDEDDDDEDYIPPIKTISRTKRRRSSFSDSEEEYVPAKVSRRGRPSKTVSVSSDNSSTSKYREMRDKNNEASRKSRQKRKMQDNYLEKEMEELAMYNLKLKAQVSELEKSVSRFRTNLMQILIKK